MNEYNKFDNNSNNDDDNERLLLKKPLLSSRNNIQSPNKNNSRFIIDEYDNNCGNKYKIKQLITLKLSYIKIILYLILNIITLGFINIFINYFPSLNLYLFYDEVEIDKSLYIGIYDEDGYFYIHKLQTFILPIINDIPLKKYIISNIPLKKRKIFTFEFKYFKYIYNDYKNCFSAILFKINTTEDNIIKNFWNGLTQDEIDFQKIIYGKNEIKTEDNLSSNIKILFNCFKKPFNLYIIFSVILFAINNYKIYSAIILIFFLYFLKENISQKKYYFQKLKNFECQKGDILVEVNRFFQDNKEENDNVEYNALKMKKNVKDLVPGEIYELTNEISIIPCDSILISGVAIVNEDIITGESTPVYKSSLSLTNNIFNYEKNKINILYSGTKIIQSFLPKNLNGENYPKALVIGTSFMTQKGNIIRSIICQEKENNKFDDNVNRYIYGLILFSIFIILMSLCILLKIKKSSYEILIIILNLMTIIVQPILPICLNIGIYNSSKRLKNQNIKCINQKVMNKAGTIDTICLEPIELLCEDNIDIYGIYPVILLEDDKIVFDKIYNNLYENISRGYINFKNRINCYNSNHIIRNFNEDYNQLIIECMACCNILFFDNNQKVIGNIIDLKMFESSKWKFKKYNGGLIDLYLRPPQENVLQSKMNNFFNENNEDYFKTHYEIGIIKYFEFSQKYQRTGVLVKNFNEKYYKYFVKGSPEIIKELCVINSLPDNYDAILNYNLKEGNQIIALAYSYKNINIINRDIIDREKLESDIRFLGFLIIKNKIKLDSKVLIEKLKNEKYNIFLSTYKNTLTTINISKRCQIIKPENILFSIMLDENNNLKFTHLENYSDTEKFEMIEKFYELESNMKNEILDDSYFDEQFGESSYTEENKSRTDELNDYYLNIELKEKTNNSFPSINNHVMILDGNTFEKIYLLRNKYISTKDNNYLIYFNAFNLILNKCRLFSSMNSFNKMILIQSLKEKGKTSCIFSNIINDFGSLKIANVGISFSDNNDNQNLIQDYIINKENSINSILYLLLEGKASLVTSIQIFKTLIIYSFIQLISVIYLIYSRTFYTYKYFIISDILIIIPISFLVSRTDTNKKSNEYKLTGGIINSKTLVSLIFQAILFFFFQILSVFFLNIKKCQKLSSKDYNNTLIFYISNYQYLIISLSFSITYPFKKNIFTNTLLIAYFIFGFSYFTYIFFTPNNFSLKLLNLIFFPSYIFRTTFIIICILNLISSYLCESYLVPYIIYYYFNDKNEETYL